MYYHSEYSWFSIPADYMEEMDEYFGHVYEELKKQVEISKKTDHCQSMPDTTTIVPDSKNTSVFWPFPTPCMVPIVPSKHSSGYSH